VWDAVAGGRQGAPGFDPARLRAARAAAALTQGALAEAINVSRSEVAFWEIGTRVPQVETVAALARALHIKPSDLLDHDAAGGPTVQHLRAAAGLSQQRAAERAGLLRTTYSVLERGEKANPSASDIAALARALGVANEQARAAYEISRANRLAQRDGD
jgi:transcriptional regulator with XRE-family HTH domain